MPPVKGTKKNGFFTRDENVLPFFSWHEKTKLGTILRIALVAFMAFTVIISLVARYAHITLSSASSFLPMTYAIPLAIVFALVVLALFKRMRSTFSRVTVGVVAAMVVLLAISILSSYLNLMPLLLLSQNEVSLPKKYAGLQVKGEDYKQNIVLMHQYGRPDGSHERKTETGADDLVCPYKVDAIKITVSAANDEELTASGAIYVLPEEIDKLNIEWLDDDTARIYLSDDATALIPEEMIASADVIGDYKTYTYVFENTDFMSDYSSVSDGTGQRIGGLENNERAGHKLNIYRSETQAYKATSIYQMSPESLKQIYTAYPSLLFNIFVKTDVRNEGEIVVEPYGTLNEFELAYDSAKDTLTVRPGGEFTGASGEIVLYLNEKYTQEDAAQLETAASQSAQPAPINGSRAFNEISVKIK